VNVCVDVFGTVDLDHPVHFREVESSRSDVGRKEDRVLGRHEARVYLQSLHLFLLSVYMQERHARPQMPKGLEDVPNLFAGRKEDERLVREVGLEEGPERVELRFQWDCHVELLEIARHLDG
jgi:hypothetical protein